MTLTQAIEAQSKARIYLIGVCLVLLIGAVDYLTPYEISLFMFYTGPVLLIAWCGSRRAAILLALSAALVSWAANLSTQPWSLHVYAWRGVNNVICLVLVAFGGSAMRARQNILEAHVNELERARLLEEEILRVSEREQMRMGQDLHDGLCQHLAGISCAMQCLQWEISGDSASAMDSAAFIQEQLRDAAREARDLARGAFPVQMNADGLMAALNELVVATERLRSIPVHLIARGEIVLRDPHVALHLYRIVQEGLNNAVKHSDASEIEIEIEIRDGILSLRIADNGIGMTSPLGSSGGMGLQTMSYRAGAIGAELVFEKNAGGGTVVRCWLPLVETGDAEPASTEGYGAVETRADAAIEDRDEIVPAHTL